MIHKFSLGQICATPGVMEIRTDQQRRGWLARHASGDWGCVDDLDRRANDEALVYGSRILSAYPIDESQPCKGHCRIGQEYAIFEPI